MTTYSRQICRHDSLYTISRCMRAQELSCNMKSVVQQKSTLKTQEKTIFTKSLSQSGGGRHEDFFYVNQHSNGCQISWYRCYDQCWSFNFNLCHTSNYQLPTSTSMPANLSTKLSPPQSKFGLLVPICTQAGSCALERKCTPLWSCAISIATNYYLVLLSNHQPLRKEKAESRSFLPLPMYR